MVVQTRWAGFAFRCVVAAGIAAACWPAHAQTSPAIPPAPKAIAQTDTPEKPPPSAIPLADVPKHAEETAATLAEIQDELSSDRTVQTVEQELRVLAREIEARLAENRKAVTRTASIETLRRIEARGSPLRRSLASLSRQLTRRLNPLGHDLAQLDDLTGTWQRTLAEARGSAPAAVLRRMEELIAEIGETRRAVAAQRTRILTVQNRVAVQDSRVADALTAVRRARENVEENIFDRDSAPIWSPELRSHGTQNFWTEIRISVATQWTAVQAYGERQGGRFLGHGAFFVALTVLLYWTRRRVRRWLKDEPNLADTGAIFDAPMATALLLSILGGFRIYPDAPIFLLAMLGALALIPTAVIVRRLIEPQLYPVLYALVVFYFIDQVRAIAAPVQLLPRVVFLAEMLGAAAFAAWLLVSAGRRFDPETVHTRPPESRRGGRPGRIVRWASALALAFSLSAFTANALGHVGLASLLGNTLLSCAYVGLILYAVVEILDGFSVMALHLPPFTLLGAVRRHRVLIAQRLRRLMQWLAVAALAIFALDRLALRERLFRAARNALTAEGSWGSIHVSLGDVLAFAVSVWAALLVSRFVRFLLEEDVYTRFNLGRGMPYAISAMLNYVILIVGFLVGVAALGFDMTKFTILAGAFTIGVGFGLQNIFNNFVSGLILLFERPVKVGDVIQIEDVSGIVERIGIRASTVRASTGSEIIVPNGKLISERVVNWTFSRHERSIQLPIAVPIGTDLTRVIRTLEQVARNHPLVAKGPPPKAIVVRMGPDWIGLELHAWTERVDQWMEIRSDLAVAAATALAAENIPVR